MPLALANSAKRNAIDVYAEAVSAAAGSPATNIQTKWEATASSSRDMDPMECIIDACEYDVPTIFESPLIRISTLVYGTL